MSKNRGVDYSMYSNHRPMSSREEEDVVITSVPNKRRYDVKVINTEKLYVRSSPEVKTNNMVRILNHGDGLQVQDENSEWVQVFNTNKESNEYVMKKFLKEV